MFVVNTSVHLLYKFVLHWIVPYPASAAIFHLAQPDLAAGLCNYFKHTSADFVADSKLHRQQQFLKIVINKLFYITTNKPYFMGRGTEFS